MVAWYWLIVSALGSIVFAKLCEEFFDWDNFLTEMISSLTIAVIFIPFCIYHIFFKLTIDPIPEERMNRVGIVPWKRWGNLCLCFDKKASRFWNKIFFARIKKKPIDK